MPNKKNQLIAVQVTLLGVLAAITKTLPSKNTILKVSYLNSVVLTFANLNHIENYSKECDKDMIKLIEVESDTWKELMEKKWIVTKRAEKKSLGLAFKRRKILK